MRNYQEVEYKVTKGIGVVQINLERKVGRGDAKEVICNAVQNLKADMLVMGTHDYGFFKR